MSRTGGIHGEKNFEGRRFHPGRQSGALNDFEKTRRVWREERAVLSFLPVRDSHANRMPFTPFGNKGVIAGNTAYQRKNITRYGQIATNASIYMNVDRKAVGLKSISERGRTSAHESPPRRM